MCPPLARASSARPMPASASTRSDAGVLPPVRHDVPKAMPDSSASMRLGNAMRVRPARRRGRRHASGVPALRSDCTTGAGEPTRVVPGSATSRPGHAATAASPAPARGPRDASAARRGPTGVPPRAAPLGCRGRGRRSPAMFRRSDHRPGRIPLVHRSRCGIRRSPAPAGPSCKQGWPSSAAGQGPGLPRAAYAAAVNCSAASRA